MNQLESHYLLVEEIISELNIDPKTARGTKAGQWSLRKGSAKVWIDVWYIEKENRSYFQVMSPVVEIPKEDQQLEFYRDLLTLNDKFFGVAFSLFKGWAWIKHIRETEGLDKSEAKSIIQRVGNYADQWDDKLREKYGSSETSDSPNKSSSQEVNP